MKLQVISSGSEGNAYILSNDKEALLIECGVNFNDVKQALNFDLSKVVGCLLTHEHGDHSKGIKSAMASGINIYSTEGTFKALGLDKSHRAIITFFGDNFRAGGFRIRPFDVKHDAADPLGFMIHHEETGNVLFMTDTKYCEYLFQGLNNIIIEANYCETILKERRENGREHKYLADRIYDSHMSLQNCKGALGAYDLAAVSNIVLIHLSNRNSDEARFKTEVQQQTGKRVHVAVNGLTIPFNKKAF